MELEPPVSRWRHHWRASCFPESPFLTRSSGTAGRGGGRWEATSEEGNDAVVLVDVPVFVGSWLPAVCGRRVHGWLAPATLYTACRRTGEAAPAFFRGAKSPPHGFHFFQPSQLAIASCPSLWTPRVKVSQLHEPADSCSSLSLFGIHKPFLYSIKCKK